MMKKHYCKMDILDKYIDIKYDGCGTYLDCFIIDDMILTLNELGEIIREEYNEDLGRIYGKCIYDFAEYFKNKLENCEEAYVVINVYPFYTSNMDNGRHVWQHKYAYCPDDKNWYYMWGNPVKEGMAWC